MRGLYVDRSKPEVRLAIYLYNKRQDACSLLSPPNISCNPEIVTIDDTFSEIVHIQVRPCYGFGHQFLASKHAEDFFRPPQVEMTIFGVPKCHLQNESEFFFVLCSLCHVQRRKGCWLNIPSAWKASPQPISSECCLCWYKRTSNSFLQPFFKKHYADRTDKALGWGRVAQ